MNYFILSKRRSNGAILCSPLAFPEAEARRRLHERSLHHKPTHDFAIVPAPPEHPVWFPELDRGSYVAFEEFMYHLTAARRAFAALKEPPVWPEEERK
jgi:hypothetical protein